MTPDEQLLYAAEHGSCEGIERALTEGAGVNARDGRGATSLHWAATGLDGLEASTLLMDRGAAINSKTHDGYTPLHYAAITGQKATAALLIERGADLNAKNAEGNTPLHNASAANCTEVATLLVDRGAEINVKNDAGNTPLDIANGKGYSDLILMLETARERTTPGFTGRVISLRAGAEDKPRQP